MTVSYCVSFKRSRDITTTTLNRDGSSRTDKVCHHYFYAADDEQAFKVMNAFITIYRGDIYEVELTLGTRMLCYISHTIGCGGSD